jgi:acetyl esterase/lipase
MRSLLLLLLLALELVAAAAPGLAADKLLIKIPKVEESSGWTSARAEPVPPVPSNCTPPHPLADSRRPFCVVPRTVSDMAREFLASRSPFTLYSVDPATAGSASAAAANARAARTLYDAAQAPSSKDAAALHLALPIVETKLGGVPVSLAAPKSAPTAANTSGAPVLFYLHGGAYVVGECSNTWSVPAPIADKAGMRIACVDYRLAPEHPFPAALDDALAAYKALQQQGFPGGSGGGGPVAASRIALVGESAGGALALALVQAAAAAGLPPPGALLLMGPWADLSDTGDTLATLSGVDPILQYRMGLASAARAYAGPSKPLNHPGVSPLYGPFQGPWPSTLIQVGIAGHTAGHHCCGLATASAGD